MNIREKIGEMFYKRLSQKIGAKIQSGMSALLANERWQSGSFVTEVSASETITVYIHPLDDGKRAEVYAETSDGKTSREWAIPSNELDDGVDSAVGAIYDVTYGDYA